MVEGGAENEILGKRGRITQWEHNCTQGPRPAGIAEGPPNVEGGRRLGWALSSEKRNSTARAEFFIAITHVSGSSITGTGTLRSGSISV